MNTSKKIPSLRNFPLLSCAAAAVIAGALSWTAPAAHAQNTTAVNKASYDNYPMLQERNIFDPDRSRDNIPRPPATQKIHSGPTPPPPPPPVTRNDYVQLTGIMMTEQETFAFFAGSQTEYNKVVPVNGTIAGATITKITTSNIEVMRNGKSVTITVGQTVPLDGSSAPGLPPSSAAAPAPVIAPVAPVTTTVPPAAASSGTDPQGMSEQVPLPDVTSGTDNPPSPPPADGVSDAMRKMMERRAKELNQ